MRLRPALRVLALALLMTQPAVAIDPPYQGEMERLAEILGSLYFLQPLCQPGPIDWRNEMEQLIALDQPDEDRRQRLAGAFNSGYTAYSRTYRVCTTSADEALSRLLAEAGRIARDIHARYAQ